MMSSLLKYVHQYAFATILVVASLLIERLLFLRGLSLWVLTYLLIRRVSFKTVFVLGVLLDLTSSRIIGASGIWLSLLLFVLKRYDRTNKALLWLFCFLGLSVLVAMDYAGLNFGFFLTSTIFFVVITFLWPAKLWLKRRSFEYES